MNKKTLVNINLGCGVELLKGFINVDNTLTIENLRSKKGLYRKAHIQRGAKFIQADMRKLPFGDNSADYIECLEAIEHIPFMEVEIAIKEMYRILKIGGELVLFTTDFDDIARIWVENISGQPFNPNLFFSMIQVIYGHQLTEGEYHRAAFTPIYMNGLMQACGFNDFELVVYPRGSLLPKFKGAQWPPKTMGTAMLYVKAIKH